MTIVKLRHEELGWQAHDPTLAEGEMGIDLETGTIKLGDGIKTWAELDSFVLGNGGSQSFTPTDLPDLGLWLDASELPAGALASWEDASLSGYVAVQATEASQPIVVASAQNGLSVVRFDDSGPQFMEFAEGALGLFNGLAGATIFAACGTPSGNEFACLMATQQGDDTNPRAGLTRLTNGSQYFYIGDPIEGGGWSMSATSSEDEVGFAACYGTMRVAELVAVGSSIPDNNASVSAEFVFGFENLPSEAMWIGKDTFGSSFGVVDLGEVLVVQRAVTALERRQVLEYLSAKWATL